MTAYIYIRDDQRGHLHTLIVLKGRKRNTKKLLSRKETRRKNLNRVSTPGFSLVLQECCKFHRVTQLATYISLRDPSAFRSGFMIMKMIHLKYFIRNNNMTVSMCKLCFVSIILKSTYFSFQFLQLVKSASSRREQI